MLCIVIIYRAKKERRLTMKKFTDFAEDKKRGERVNTEDFGKTGKGYNPGGQNGQIPTGAFDLFRSLAGRYEGASEEDILKAIYTEAEKSRKKGTLTNAEIDNFVSVISPMLNSGQVAKLKKLAEKLKKI